jgi:hypothetical protein
VPCLKWRRWLGVSMLMLICVMAAACAADEQNWPVGAKEVPSVIGNPDEARQKEFLAKRTKDDIAEPSGKWFMHNGSGVLGYGLPSGTKRAGETFEVSLFGHAAEGERLEREVRIRLAESHAEGEPVTIMEESVWVDAVHERTVIYKGRLPDKENAVYALHVEIIGEDGEVEDALTSVIDVPVPEINASLQTEKPVYTREENKVKLILKNAGPTRLIFGTPYQLEKKVDGIWRIVPLDHVAFQDIAILIEAGGVYEEWVDISGLERGEYRIIKDYSADGLDLQVSMAAEFQIE